MIASLAELPPLDPSVPAARLMATVEAEYADRGVELPERRYLLAGNAAGAAWDDEQVTVSLNAVQPGPSPSTRRTSMPASGVGTVLPRAVFEVRILRCWPTVDESGDAPSPEVITDATVRVMRDAGLIQAALQRYAAQDRTNATMTVGEIQPLGPSGGLVGYAVVITLSPIA